MKTFKILLFNTGYCLGLNGSTQDYLKYFYRYLFCPKRIQKKILENIDQLLDEENPDLCLFLELHKESKLFRRFNHLHFLLDEKYRHFHMTNKYAQNGFLRRLPVLRRKSNGFLAKRHVPFRTHYFRAGRKKLIYELSLPEKISLFMTHFSLQRSTREKQFHQLRSIIGDRKRVIVCGDFNIASGYKELQPLLDGSNLQIVTSNTQGEKTFPSADPQKAFDLFLCSANLPISSCKVLEHILLSDHLPVMVELDFS